LERPSGKAPAAPHAEARSRADGPTHRRRRLPLIGAQISTAGGFAPVPGRAVAIGAQAVQIFSSNPRTWQTRTADAEEMAALVAGLRRHRLPLFFHTIYLINLASPDEPLRLRSAQSLAHALVTGARAGAAGVVTHVGSHKGDGPHAALCRVVETVGMAVAQAHASLAAQKETQPLPPLLLETGAGAGTIVGGRLEELAALVVALNVDGAASSAARSRPKSLTVGVCLDTAHMFAAGYPLHEEDGLDAMIDELRTLGLLPRVGLVHLNDSGAEFASNRDRHADPGEGLIGYESLGRVVRHPALSHIPFVLETPGADGHGPDAGNIAVVKAMRAGVPAPRKGLARAARRQGA